MAGTIRHRGGDRWQIQVHAGGRRFAKTIRGTKRDAEHALPAFIVDARARAEVRPGDDITIAELADRWIAARAPDWSPKTLKETRAKVRLHIAPAIGDIAVDDLRPLDLEDLYARLRAKMSPSSVHHVHRVIRAMLNQAVRWDIIATSPASRVTPPRVVRPEIVPPTPDQLRTLVAEVAADVPFAALVRLAHTTGARRGQLVALRWTDIDMAAGVVTFSRAITEGDEGPVEKGTKTGRTHRVAIDPATVAQLRQLRRWQIERGLAAGVQVGDDARLFARDLACQVPWRPDDATGKWVRARVKAGLDGPKAPRLHDLRHFVATQLLAAGEDVVTVAARLGHATPNVTLSTYSHFLPEKDREAADRIAAVTDVG